MSMALASATLRLLSRRRRGACPYFLPKGERQREIMWYKLRMAAPASTSDLREEAQAATAAALT
ncbi:MAG: hypothetical protein ACPGUV_13935, partial [Polyangiales bacterium]